MKNSPQILAHQQNRWGCRKGRKRERGRKEREKERERGFFFGKIGVARLYT